MKKKIMNDSKQICEQMLEGIAYAYSDHLQRIEGTGIFLRKDPIEKKVAIISGGGSGHEPAHAGYVGKGMLDACVCGPVFIPPSAEEILLAIETVDQGQGVLLIVKNFEADVKAFMKAQSLAQKKGHQVETVLVADDCSIDKASFKQRRRGVAGTVFVQKILGAASQDQASLKALKALGDQVVKASNTLGVALEAGVYPGEAKAAFALAEDEISFGVGIHGEEGYRIEKFTSSERLAIELLNKLKNQYHWRAKDRFAMMVNGLGSTPLMELFVFTNDLRRLLVLEDLDMVFKKVGNYMTSNDMAGLSLTFLKIEDERWLDYLQAPCDTFAW